MRVARICRPDVIVTDMTMPAMTGIDLFNALQADDVLHVIPVIFMTSGPFPSERPRRDCWLDKNTEPEQLAGKIRRLIT